MSDARVSIDPSTLFDNVEDRQLEFTGEADGEPSRFALRYDVLEAMLGTVPLDPVAAVQPLMPQVERLAGSALERDYDQELVVISENDLA